MESSAEAAGPIWGTFRPRSAHRRHRRREFASISEQSSANTETAQRNDPDEIFAGSIRAIVSGVGFLIVSMVLLLTNVAGGKAWWWAMLFPAFTFFARGFSELAKSKRMERSQGCRTRAARTCRFCSVGCGSGAFVCAPSIHIA
jgi:hypothetical protein